MDNSVKDLFNRVRRDKYIMPALMIIAVLVISIILGPQISGFATGASKLDECKSDLGICALNVDTLTEERNTLQSEVSALQNTITEKNTYMDEIKDEYDAEINELNEKYDKLVDSFNGIVDNSGKNICCKMKIDNSDIDSFNIIDNKIECATDGTFELNCDYPD
jgi:hypothetical protein